MRILHLSTNDIAGGAARAAFRLHTGLTRLGHDSSMLVLKRSSNDPNVRQLEWDGEWILRAKRKWRRRQIRRDFEIYKHTVPPGFEAFSDDRSEAGYDLIRQLPECDLINLHWVAGFIDYQLFFDHLPAGVPIVWRLADMAPFTGGCHYDLGCGKFSQTCGACPVLDSQIDLDLSRQIWGRKNGALSKLDPGRLHIVGTSKWIAEQAKRSSLLSRFSVTVIPNGLDTDEFSPREKNLARDMLNIPQQAKVVLFVADSAAIKRKGFDYLTAALASLGNEPDLFLLSVGGGKPAVANLPQKHLGKVADDRLLSTIYSAADVFVIPSLQESFGQTITESMACGTPVVGFDTGGIPDMVRPGVTGYLASVGDATALAAAIKKALGDPAKLREMGENCRRIAVAEYAMEVQARAYAAHYEAILASGSVR